MLATQSESGEVTMPSKKLRTFHQATFQWACEMSGHHSDVTLDSVQFGSVNSVALRAEQSDEWPPPVVGYQLTCFAIGGDWSQLSFDRRGNLLSEIFGPPSAPPKIAQSREVF
jgi:hypothetical protein